MNSTKNENKTDINELRRQITEIKVKLDKASSSENRINSLLDKISIGTYKTSPDGRILYANNALIEMLDYDSLEELKKRNLNENKFEPEYSRATFLGKMEKDVVEFKSKWRMKDGSTLLMHESVQAVRDLSGNILYFEGIIRNISEEVKVNEELSLKTTLLNTHHEAAIDGILVIDENRKTVLYNQQFIDLLGLPQSLLNTKDDALLIKQHVIKMVNNPDKFIEKVEYLYNHKEVISRDEIEFKDDRVFDRYSYSLRSSTGKYYGRVWSFRDVTSYKLSEKELQQLILLHEGVLASIDIGICLIGKDNKILWSNSGMKKIMAQVENSDPSIFPFSDAYKTCCGKLNKLTYKTCSCVYNEKIKSSTKNGLIFEITCVFFDPDNFDKGIVCTVTDITELEKAKEKEAEQKMQIMHSNRLRTVGQLAAGMAHEINNPLSVLHASLQNIALVESSNRKIDDDSINLMIRVTQRIRKIINNLLLFSRQKSVEKIPQDINDVLNRSLDFIESIFKKKQIIFIKNLSSELPNVNISSQQMQQVFINITVNAIDSMSNGGTLEVTTEKKNNFIEITFKDSGKGIHEDNVEKIFTPFFTTKKVGEGMGLGLSISYGIVKEHGGKIMVSSKVNKGTILKVVLPI